MTDRDELPIHPADVQAIWMHDIADLIAVPELLAEIARLRG